MSLDALICATLFQFNLFDANIVLEYIYLYYFQGFPQLPEANIVNTSHRAALQHANANSCGFFVSQDSSFGNQILPVLPRFDTK